MRVAQTTVHALTREGWCQMRCIPSQKNPPVLPALGNTSMKRIDPNAAKGLITVGTERRQKPPNKIIFNGGTCLLYTSPSPRDLSTSRMPSSA